MSRDSLINRINLIKSEVESLTKVLAVDYFNFAKGIIDSTDQYDKNKEKLAVLNSDLKAAVELLG